MKGKCLTILVLYLLQIERTITNYCDASKAQCLLKARPKTTLPVIIIIECIVVIVIHIYGAKVHHASDQIFELNFTLDRFLLMSE